METVTEPEYLMGDLSPAKTSSDSKADRSSAATDEDDPFFGMY